MFNNYIAQLEISLFYIHFYFLFHREDKSIWTDFNLRDHVSQLYSTTGNIIVLYTFSFLIS